MAMSNPSNEKLCLGRTLALIAMPVLAIAVLVGLAMTPTAWLGVVLELAGIVLTVRAVLITDDVAQRSSARSGLLLVAALLPVVNVLAAMTVAISVTFAIRKLRLAPNA